VKGEYFNEIARHWSLLGPPLRPSEPDIAGYRRGLEDFSGGHALILGVTPELYSLPWPEGTEVAAVDHNPQMIEAVWPGPAGSARLSTWVEIPFSESSIDLVLCDGGLSVVRFADEAERVVREVARVLRQGALAVFRVYDPPAQRESAAEVLEALLAGRIPSPNHLKLRLGMAMQEDPRQGVRLSEIWNRLHEGAPDFRYLAACIGWDYDQLCAINTYRESSNCYYFPPLESVLTLFEANGFRREYINVPSYEMGGRCPVAGFRRVN